MNNERIDTWTVGESIGCLFIAFTVVLVVVVIWAIFALPYPILP